MRGPLGTAAIRLGLLLALGSSITASGQPAFGPWTQDGYDQQRSARSHLVGPRGEPAIRWTVPLRTSHIHPAIGPDGTVYTSAESPVGDRYLFVAIAPEDGSILWSRPVNNVIYNTPCIGADGTIYINDSGPYVYAFSPAGQLIWEAITSRSTHCNLLLRDDNSLVVATYAEQGTAHLIALDGETGAELWRSTAETDLSDAMLGPEGELLMTAHGNTSIRAFSSEGKPLWTYNALTMPLGSRGTVGPTGLGYFADDRGRIVALRPDEGTPEWQRDMGDQRFFAPAIGRNDRLIVGDKDGVVRSIGPNQGRLFWEVDLGEDGRTSASVDAEGVIYFCANDTLLALLPSGKELWRHQFSSRLTETTPVITEGRVYVGSGAALHAIERRCITCDMNCDDTIDMADVEPFVDLLLGGQRCGYCTGDTNGDGAVDAFDIEPFLGCLMP